MAEVRFRKSIWPIRDAVLAWWVGTDGGAAAISDSLDTEEGGVRTPVAGLPDLMEPDRDETGVCTPVAGRVSMVNGVVIACMEHVEGCNRSTMPANCCKTTE